MKTNFKDLLEKRQEIITRYGNKEEITTKGEYGIDKWIKTVSKALEKVQEKYRTEFNDVKSDIDVDCAFEKDGVLVKNDKNEYQYSKEGEKNRIKRLTEAAKVINDACEAEEIEFEPYLVDAETINETNEEFIELNKNIFIK